MDLKELLENQNKAFEEFKATIENRFAEVDKGILELAKKAGRPGAPYSTTSKEAQDSLVKFLRDGDTSGLVKARETKAAVVGSDPGGGWLVPEQIDSEIGSIREKNNPMRQICRVLRPETQEYKKIVTTSRPASGWVGETEARTETDTPDIAVVTPAWGGLYANPAASQDLIEDSAFDIAEWFRDEVTKEFSDQEGEAFVTGNGIKKPRGFLSFTMVTTTDATRAFGDVQYRASGVAGGMAADNLVDLVHDLKAKYRQNAVWVMNSLTLAAVRKFKDGDGNYLWRAGVEAGQPNLLLGHPVVECDFMPDIGADEYPIAFGDFREAFWIFDRPTTVLRDPYSNKPYVHFYTATRVGTMLANSEALKVLKLSVA